MWRSNLGPINQMPLEEDNGQAQKCCAQENSSLMINNRQRA